MPGKIHSKRYSAARFGGVQFEAEDGRFAGATGPKRAFPRSVCLYTAVLTNFSRGARARRRQREKGNMSGLIQRLLPRAEAPVVESGAPLVYPKVLVVTVDVRLYADVLSAANSRVWQVDWARSVESALAVSRFGAQPIILYDEALPWADWHDAFSRLHELPHNPRLVLAARGLDEQLWRSVLSHGGYDAVERNAPSGHLRQALHFAWLSVCQALVPDLGPGGLVVGL
jgi:hypothetical protein